MQKIQAEPEKRSFIEETHYIEFDEEMDTSNHMMAKNHTTSQIHGVHAHAKISDNRRPIYGVLTEPLRGGIKDTKNPNKEYQSNTEDVSYIPKAHVQFLE